MFGLEVQNYYKLHASQVMHVFFQSVTQAHAEKENPSSPNFAIQTALVFKLKGSYVFALSFCREGLN